MPGSILSHILSSYPSTQSSERYKILEDSQELEQAYHKAALDGSSEAPTNPEDEVDFHYTCFVKSNSQEHLYELDGDVSGPILAATLAPEEDVLCEAAVNVIKRYIAARGAESIGFSLLALVSC